MKRKLIYIPQNFVYPLIPQTQYHFGGGQVIGNILRPDGDWRPYLPPTEEQRRNGIETSSCFIEAQQHTIATILEEQFDLPDQNFSARFNLIYSGATSSGGDPLKAADSFRKQGLIPDSFLPFSDTIKNWDEFRSFLGGDKTQCEAQGKTWRSFWEPKYDIVVKREDKLEDKRKKLKEALKYSPLPVSVYGVLNGDTYVQKPKGATDNHLVELIYIDDQDCGYIFDTYAPFVKKLPPSYDHDFGLRYTVEKQVTREEANIFTKMLQAISAFLAQWKPTVPTTLPVAPVAPTPAPIQPIVAPSKYDWDTPVLARHSVRVICDEEKLTLEQKDTMCATIGSESGWTTTAVNYNKKNGKVTSTDYGICQWNDYYHGQEITPDEALHNPEKSVRLMCVYWKRGQRDLWAAYQNGSYKKYL